MTWPGRPEPEKRRAPPLGVKLAAALRQLLDAWRKLGIIGADEEVRLDFDHNPALGLRDVDPVTRHHIPHQHDVDSLEWKIERLHDVKTRGRGATTAGSDVGEMRKTRNLVKKRQAREQRAPTTDDAPPARQRPKARIPSRGFEKGHRPFPNRKSDKPSKKDRRR